MKPENEKLVRMIVGEELDTHCHNAHAPEPQPEPVACHCGRWAWHTDLGKWECTGSPPGAARAGDMAYLVRYCNVCGDECRADGTITPNPARAKSAEPRLDVARRAVKSAEPVDKIVVDELAAWSIPEGCTLISARFGSWICYTQAQLDAAVTEAVLAVKCQQDSACAKCLSGVAAKSTPDAVICQHCGGVANAPTTLYSQGAVDIKVAEAVAAARADERRIVNEEREAAEKQRWEDYHRAECYRLEHKRDCAIIGTCLWYCLDDELRRHSAKLPPQEPSA